MCFVLYCFSSSEKSIRDKPKRPARPIRCMYVSQSCGTSRFITKFTLSASIPLDVWRAGEGGGERPCLTLSERRKRVMGDIWTDKEERRRFSPGQWRWAPCIGTASVWTWPPASGPDSDHLCGSAHTVTLDQGSWNQLRQTSSQALSLKDGLSPDSQIVSTAC